MGDRAERQGLLGGRSFPFQGLVGAESSKPSTPMEHSRHTWGPREEVEGSCERERVYSLARDLVFNFALL